MESVPSRLGAFQEQRLYRLGVRGLLGPGYPSASKDGSEASTRMALGTRTVGAPRRKEAVRDGDTYRPSPRCRDRTRSDYPSWRSYPSALRHQDRSRLRTSSYVHHWRRTSTRWSYDRRSCLHRLPLQHYWRGNHWRWCNDRREFPGYQRCSRRLHSNRCPRENAPENVAPVGFAYVGHFPSAH